MALKKKKEVKVEDEQVQTPHVVEHLDRDPNDVRVQNPTVDGNDQPNVDINVPQ